MIEPSALIAGTDFSAGAASALRLAAAWAGRSRVELEILHATGDVGARLVPSGDEAAPLALDASLRALLEETPAALGDATLARRTCLGPPAEALRRRAGEVARSWLVVGCEGTSAGLLRAPGSVAADLAASPPSPLLVAPPRWAPPRAGHAARRRKRTEWSAHAVMVALSAAAVDRARDEALVRYGSELAARHGARLAVAHAIDLSFARGYPSDVRTSLRERARAEAAAVADRLRALLLEAVPDDFAASTDVAVHVVRQGPPERDLAGLAAAQDVDVLIVGAGRIAARLVAHAPCAMLVLPRVT